MADSIASSLSSRSSGTARSGVESNSVSTSHSDLDEVETRIVIEDHCRAICRNHGQDLICDKGSNCRRKGHAALRQSEETRGAPGIYEVLLSSRGRPRGLLAHTGVNVEEFRLRQETIRADNQTLAETLQFLQDDQPASSDSLLRAPEREGGPNGIEGKTNDSSVNSNNVEKSQDPSTNQLLATLVKSIGALTDEVRASRNDYDRHSQKESQGTKKASGRSKATPMQSGILRNSNTPTRTSHDGVSLPTTPSQRDGNDILQHLENTVSEAPQSRNDVALTSMTSLKLGSSNLGKDPSTGDKEKVYNLRISDSNGLAKGLSPSQLSKDGAMMFAEGLPDVTAFPKGEGTSDFTEGSMMLNVLNTMVSTQYGSQSGLLDTTFKSAKRNILQQIKSYEQLQELSTTFSEDVEDLLNTMMGRLADTLITFFGISEDEAKLLITITPLYRIGVRTCELWASLLNTLISTYHTGGWKVCEVHLKYHAGKFAKFREMYPRRIQVLVSIYAYLRDGSLYSFRPQKLLAKQIDLLQNRSVELSGNNSNEATTLSTTPVQPQIKATFCKHCGTSLHNPSGRCPWKGLTAHKAKNAAAKALQNLASGITTGAVSEESPDENKTTG